MRKLFGWILGVVVGVIVSDLVVTALGLTGIAGLLVAVAVFVPIVFLGIAIGENRRC